MINSSKQQRLKQLSNSEYKQFKKAIADIDLLLPKLCNMDYRLFNTEDEYNQSRPQSDDRKRSKLCEDPDLIAQDFLDALANIHAILDYYPLDEFPLYLSILIESADAYGLWVFPYHKTRFDQDDVQQLNGAVRYIQRRLGDRDTMLEIKRMEIQGVRQARSIKQYIDSLVNAFAKLQVIRIDVHYQKDLPIRYSQVHQHREQLIRYLREKHLGHAHIGHIWKLEYGLRKGYHLHMFIFMDGSKIQQNILHAKKICEPWNDVITQGRGTSYNCNAKQEKYQDNGIGKVEYFDENKINALHKASNYLLKYDPYIEIMQQAEARALLEEDSVALALQISKGRVFGKGQLPNIRIRRGRPRSLNRDGERMLEAVLLVGRSKEAI